MANSHLVLILLKVAAVLKEDRQMTVFLNHALKMILEITTHYPASATVAYILTGLFIMMSLRGLNLSLPSVCSLLLRQDTDGNIQSN